MINWLGNVQPPDQLLTFKVFAAVLAVGLMDVVAESVNLTFSRFSICVMRPSWTVISTEPKRSELIADKSSCIKLLFCLFAVSMLI